MDKIELAKLFHKTYERLAPEFLYETRRETRNFNEKTANGKLMIAVCDIVLRHLTSAIHADGDTGSVCKLCGYDHPGINCSDYQ